MQSVEVSASKLAPDETVLAQSRWRKLIGGLSAVGRRIGNPSERVAQRLVLRSLSQMKRGHLTVAHGDEQFQFGQDAEGIRAQINVHDARAYSFITYNGVLGAAEAYMHGYWSSPCLLSVVRFMVQNLDDLQSMNNKNATIGRFVLALMKLINRNSLTGSRANIASHYDLGDDFFELFLDPEMMYSAAYYKTPDMTLDEAAIEKLDRICRKLELKPEDHLLEIGSGWGGMAIYAARHYGCRVTTTTISNNQFEFTQQRVRELGLQDQITVLCEDYRQLSGTFDKLVSVEMIEAVGHQYYEEYFRQCSTLLKDDGLMLIQAITIPDQRYVQARDSVDFIKRYIFPGGCLPSVSVIADQTRENTDMNIVDMFDMTQYYAKTLAEWRERFDKSIDNVQALGCDSRFINMWQYYLCYCEGGFRERVIGTYQFLLAKPDYRPVV